MAKIDGFKKTSLRQIVLSPTLVAKDWNYKWKLAGSCVSSCWCSRASAILRGSPVNHKSLMTPCWATAVHLTSTQQSRFERHFKWSLERGLRESREVKFAKKKQTRSNIPTCSLKKDTWPLSQSYLLEPCLNEHWILGISKHFVSEGSNSQVLKKGSTDIKTEKDPTWQRQEVELSRKKVFFRGSSKQ